MFHAPLDEKHFLRILEERDAPKLFAAVDANRERLREWLPWLDANREVRDSRDFIRATLQQFAAGKGPTAGIWDEDRLVGVIGFHEIRAANRFASIGYWISKEAEGRGLITSAVRALVSHGFWDLGLNRIEIRCATGNTRSQRVPERLGFKMEGIAREAEWLYGRCVDHKVYAMLKSEWRDGA